MEILKPLPKHVMSDINNNILSNNQLAQLLVSGSISNHLSNCFHSISAVYPFTTEPINEYLKNVDLEGKSVLTVASSGDHLLSAVNKGASFITTFDISCLTEFYQELKIAAVLKLSYKDFLEFFAGTKIFDNDTYDFVRGALSIQTRQFWDALFDYYEGKEISDSQLFIDQDPNQNKITNWNSYLNNEDEYLKTRENLKKIHFNFYNLNVLQLPSTLIRKFDIVMLSNIPQYTSEMGSSTKELADYIKENLTSLLKENGSIIATIFGNDSTFNQLDEDVEIKKLNTVISSLTFKKK